MTQDGDEGEESTSLFFVGPGGSADVDCNGPFTRTLIIPFAFPYAWRIEFITYKNCCCPFDCPVLSTRQRASTECGFAYS